MLRRSDAMAAPFALYSLMALLANAWWQIEYMRHALWNMSVNAPSPFTAYMDFESAPHARQYQSYTTHVAHTTEQRNASM
jgi:hypothetical protein